ncbi:MAG: hypothetical protein AB1631_07480 [Acidobacteriota bacterium]
MTLIHGSIKQNDQILFEEIEIQLFETKDARSGLDSWYGSFTLPQGMDIEPGGPYHLLLEDRRSGNIIVTSNRVSSNLPTIVSFLGSGSLN